MAPITVHIHGSEVTFDLKIKSYQDLKKEVAAIEGNENFTLKLNNKAIDEKVHISSLDGCHIDIEFPPISGELCIMY